METLYIYQEPFNGIIENTMHNGTVGYTGEETRRTYINENGSKVTEILFENQLNFDEYNELKGGNCKIATEEEISRLFFEYEENSILTSFTETTEERYNDGLECLPPKRWHKFKGLEIFFVGECYTSNIYRCYIFFPDTKKYYSAFRRISETSEELESKLLESIKN
jgi:hypothetical protein